jgi:tetratricopeptide (TPR) repeat protein
MIWKIIIVITAAVASYFIPTPQELRDSFTSGQNFYASGNFLKAIEQYDIIIDTDSDFLKEDSVKVDLFSGDLVVSVVVAAYYQKANALKNLENKDGAIQIFRIVESRQDEQKLAALAQYQIYDIFYRSAQYDSAIIEARHLAEKYPNNDKAETALYDIGWAHKELNDLEKSDAAFSELIEKYPETVYLPRAIYQLGQNNFEQKNYDISIEYWIELNEQFKPEAFKEQDWENVQLKSVKERQIFEATAGRETDETVLELVAKAQVKIGDAYKEKGEYNEAILNYRKVVSTYTLLPVLIEVSYIKMAEYTLSEKGIDSARYMYQSAIDENFSNPELQAKMQYKIAEMYQNHDMFNIAASEYEFYIKAYSEVAPKIEFDVDKAQYSIVAMYYNGKKYESASAWADTLITNFPYSDAIPGALYLKGLSLISLKQYADARNAFQLIINDYPESPDIGNAKVQIGFSFSEEGKHEQALDHYNEAIAKYPKKIDSSQVFFDLISTYSELKRYDEAIASFDNVKFGSPYYPAAFGKLIKIYGLRSEYEKGIELLNKISEKDKTADSVYYQPDINFAFADLYISQNNFATANDYLTSVIEDSLADESKKMIKMQATYARGVLNYQLQDFPSAIKDLELVRNDAEFISRFPAYSSTISERLALSYSKTGKIEIALQMIEERIAAAPTQVEKGNLYAIISNIYYESGDYKKAIESAGNVINEEGVSEENKVGSYITLSQSYKALGQDNKSAEVLLEASEKFPDSPEIPAVLYSLAALYFDSFEYEKAADFFNKFITRYPDNPNAKDARYFRAYAYFESGSWMQSFNSFKQFVSAYPQDPLAAESQYFGAEALFNGKEYSRAINEYRIVYSNYPGSDFAPQALYNEAWCYFELQQAEKMVDAFKRLAQRFPNSSYAGDGLFTIGDYYYNLKDYQNAADAYTELITRFPNYSKVEEAKNLVYDLSQINSYLEYEKAMKLFDNRDYENAIVELKKLYEKYPEASIIVGCQVNIAASYEMLEEYREAAKWYKQIINRYENSRDDNERSAVIFAKEHLEWIESNYL